MFAKKKFDNLAAKEEALTAVKRNSALVKSDDAKIGDLLQKTTTLREELVKCYGQALTYFGADFRSLSDSKQQELAVIVNNTKSCAALLNSRIERDVTDG